MTVVPGSGAGTEQLNQFIERVERLEEEKRALMADIKDVYAEAKATGFEPKIMRQVIGLRAMDRDLLSEQDALLDTTGTHSAALTAYRSLISHPYNVVDRSNTQ